jgi:hypothetical protein
MVAPRRPILRWLLLCALVLGMVAPATVWRAHALDHGADGPAAAEAHVHVPEEAAAVPGASAPDDAAKGHDHMPGVVAGQPALPGAGFAFREAIPVDIDWFDLTIGSLPIQRTQQLRRPPRLG